MYLLEGNVRTLRDKSEAAASTAEQTDEIGDRLTQVLSADNLDILSNTLKCCRRGIRTGCRFKANALPHKEMASPRRC